jgi:hypothetical protein
LARVFVEPAKPEVVEGLYTPEAGPAAIYNRASGPKRSLERLDPVGVTSTEQVAMERIFAVLRSRGPAWDDSRPLEEQADWAIHAAFMDTLFDQRFAALVGPLEGTRDALLVVRASSAAEIDERLALDPWTASGLLITRQISSWQLRLGSLP